MSNQTNREWRIRRVGNALKEETRNIAKNIGVSESEFVKTVIAEKVNSYPEHMKKPPLKD